jgi:hypothetical protein
MKRILVFLVALAAAGPAAAQRLDRLGALDQREFRLLSEDLGGVLAYRPQTPTEPLGSAGFDVGVGLSAVNIQNEEIFERAGSEGASSTLAVPGVWFHKGLPWGFDVGASYAAVPDSDIESFGGELRYSLVLGGAGGPALGLRGALTTLRGVDDLDLDTGSVDLSISQGFAAFTGYAGVGHVWIDSEPQGVPGLRREEFELGKVFAGIGFMLGLVNVNLEIDQTGDVTGFGIKVGLRQ